MCGFFLLFFFNLAYDKPLHTILTNVILAQTLFQTAKALFFVHCYIPLVNSGWLGPTGGVEREFECLEKLPMFYNVCGDAHGWFERTRHLRDYASYMFVFRCMDLTYAMRYRFS